MIRVRALIHRTGLTFLAGIALALICLALAWAHSAPGADHMMDADAGAVIAVCLAVIETGLGLVTALLAARLVSRRRPPLRLAPARPVESALRPRLTPRAARAGPPVLQVFLR